MFHFTCVQKPFEKEFLRISKLWAWLRQGSVPLQDVLQKPEVYSHHNRDTQNAQKPADASFVQRNKLFGLVAENSEERQMSRDKQRQMGKHMITAALPLGCSSGAWSLWHSCTWLLTPTLTSVMAWAKQGCGASGHLQHLLTDDPLSLKGAAGSGTGRFITSGSVGASFRPEDTETNKLLHWSCAVC